MFSNLIESSSHAKEFKRRGSFLLFTTSIYVVLFVITGVISIYAYDARLEQQNLEVVILLPPQEVVPDVRPVKPADQPKAAKDNNESNIPVREIAMATVATPERTPDGISTTPNKNLPLPEGMVKIGGPDYNPPGPGGGTGITPGGGRQVIPPRPVLIEEPPPAPEAPPKVPRVISKGPITGQATSLPQPPYPMIAKQAGVQGRVGVQVLIDEKGNVISATAIDGHPMLRLAAQRAAFQAKFSPTTLSGVPVRVSGVITYDFKLTR